jgi:hypothetical protein
VQQAELLEVTLQKVDFGHLLTIKRTKVKP